MNEQIEVSLKRIKNIIKNFDNSFSTADILREYSGVSILTSIPQQYILLMHNLVNY